MLVTPPTLFAGMAFRATPTPTVLPTPLPVATAVVISRKSCRGSILGGVWFGLVWWSCPRHWWPCGWGWRCCVSNPTAALLGPRPACAAAPTVVPTFDTGVVGVGVVVLGVVVVGGGVVSGLCLLRDSGTLLLQRVAPPFSSRSPTLHLGAAAIPATAGAALLTIPTTPAPVASAEAVVALAWPWLTSSWSFFCFASNSCPRRTRRCSCPSNWLAQSRSRASCTFAVCSTSSTSFRCVSRCRLYLASIFATASAAAVSATLAALRAPCCCAACSSAASTASRLRSLASSLRTTVAGYTNLGVV